MQLISLLYLVCHAFINCKFLFLTNNTLHRQRHTISVSFLNCKLAGWGELTLTGTAEDYAPSARTSMKVKSLLKKSYIQRHQVIEIKEYFDTLTLRLFG